MTPHHQLRHPVTAVVMASPSPPVSPKSDNETRRHIDHLLVNKANESYSEDHKPPITTPQSDPVDDCTGHQHERDPHARDAEFTGLFTPSWLPLLETSHPTDRVATKSTQVDGPPPSIPVPVTTTKSISLPGRSAVSTQQITMASSYDNSYEHDYMQHKPPVPKRRNTDDVSVFSETASDGTRRRSALRRTSSAANPKRVVRFEFEGKEFGTTSSPMPSAPITEIVHVDDILNEGMEEKSLLDSDDECEDEQVEHVDIPPPKRISSSQALRNLSRGPFEDDGTKWTEVVAPPDGAPSVEGVPVDSDEDADDDEMLCFGKPPTRTANANKEKPIQAVAPTEDMTAQKDIDADMAREEEDTVAELGSMHPLHTRNSARIPSQIPASTSIPKKPISPVSNNTSHITIALHNQRSKQTAFQFGSDDSDEDELFGFEDDPKRTPSKYLEHDLSDDESEEASAPIESPSLFSRTQTPHRSTSSRDSPAYPQPTGSLPRAITSPLGNLSRGFATHRNTPDYDSTTSSDLTPPSDEVPTPRVLTAATHAPTSTLASTTTSQKLRSPYHPFTTPIISPSLHSRLAAIQTPPSFVGSLSGKSGLDPNTHDASFPNINDDHESASRIQEMARERFGSAGFGAARDTKAGEFDVGMATSFVGSVGRTNGPRSLSERMRLEEFMEGRRG